MKVGQVIPVADSLQKTAASTDAASRNRKDTQSGLSSSAVEKNKIPQEEVLGKVKALLSGSYNVRFEMDQSAMKVVIRLVDSKSGDVVGQIPPEEFLKMAQMLQSPKGQLMQTTS